MDKVKVIPESIKVNDQEVMAKEAKKEVMERLAENARDKLSKMNRKQRRAFLRKARSKMKKGTKQKGE